MSLTDHERIEALEREQARLTQLFSKYRQVPIGRLEIAMRVLASLAAFVIACWASQVGAWWASFLGLIFFSGWGIGAARAWVFRQSGRLVNAPR